jgi:choline-sulfatase
MSLLTGLYAHTRGVTHNTHSLDWRGRGRTVAHAFRDHGYLTGLIGKMHFLDSNTHGFDFRLGCNDWLQYLGPKVHHYADEIASYPGYLKSVHDTGSCFPDVHGLSTGPSPWVRQVTLEKTLASDLIRRISSTHSLPGKAARFIERFRDQPFFLVAGFLKPYAPFYPPKGFAEEIYPPDQIVLPPAGDITQYPKHARDAAAMYRGFGGAIKKDPSGLSGQSTVRGHLHRNGVPRSRVANSSPQHHRDLLLGSR